MSRPVARLRGVKNTRAGHCIVFARWRPPPRSSRSSGVIAHSFIEMQSARTIEYQNTLLRRCCRRNPETERPMYIWTRGYPSCCVNMFQLNLFGPIYYIVILPGYARGWPRNAMLVQTACRGIVSLYLSTQLAITNSLHERNGA